MSKMHVLGLPGAFLVLVGFALWPAATALAQADNPLADAANKKQVAAQKLEHEITQALTKIREVQKQNPREALVMLKTYKGILENDENLSDERRTELLNVVGRRIRELTALVSDLPKGTDTSTTKSKQDIWEKYQKGSSSKGSSSDGGAFQTYKDKFSGFKQALQKDQQIKSNYEKGARVALQQDDWSNIPSSANGFSLPRDWKQKQELRKQFSGPTLSPQEVKLLKALNSVLTPPFENWKFREVIKYLQDKTGVTIAVDPNAMKEMDIEYDTTVNFTSEEKVQVRTILKGVLGQLKLAYILKDGVIQVVTPQVARETMVVRSYPIRDLLPPSDPRMGPAFNMARTQYFANQVMQMIVNTVEPGSWAVNGGKGTIWFDPITQSIVIRNSAELHIAAAAGIYR